MRVGYKSLVFSGNLTLNRSSYKPGGGNDPTEDKIPEWLAKRLRRVEAAVEKKRQDPDLKNKMVGIDIDIQHGGWAKPREIAKVIIKESDEPGAEVLEEGITFESTSGINSRSIAVVPFQWLFTRLSRLSEYTGLSKWLESMRIRMKSDEYSYPEQFIDRVVQESFEKRQELMIEYAQP